MRTDQPDHYRVLGVPSTATPEQITSAYHRLVRLHHPDLGAGRQAHGDRLSEVIAAYTVLRDPDRRAGYDRGRQPPDRQPDDHDRDHDRRASAPPPVRRRPAADEPMIRVGPVRYHGPGRRR